MSFQFALSPSDFSSSDVPKEELEETVSRGVRITYNFPWGQEPLEELWSRGNTELLQTHKGVRSKLQVSQLLLFRVLMWTIVHALNISASSFLCLSVTLPLLKSDIECWEALQLQHKSAVALDIMRHFQRNQCKPWLSSTWSEVWGGVNIVGYFDDNDKTICLASSDKRNHSNYISTVFTKLQPMQVFLSPTCVRLPQCHSRKILSVNNKMTEVLQLSGFVASLLYLCHNLLWHLNGTETFLMF